MTIASDGTPSANRRPSAGAFTGARAVLAAAALAVAGVLASRLSYVPMWDGRVYADCIVNAASEKFSFAALRCGGHASEIYIGFVVLLQSLAATSYVPMLIANTLLLLAAAIGFARVAAIAFPGRQLEMDRALLVAAFSLNPAILAAVVQPGLDFPLVTGLVWCLVFLLERKTVGAVAMGIAMAFTKETGVLLYAVLMACYGLWFVARDGKTIRARAVALARLLPLGAPLVAFGTYLYYRSHKAAAGTPVIWNATTTGEGFFHQFLVPRLDLYLINYIVMALFMNFAWIATGFIAADAFVGTVHAAHRMPRRAIDGADGRTVGFLALLTVAVGYTLTRFATFGNSRYLVTLMALLLFPFLAALIRLRLRAPVRHAVLGVFAVVLVISSVRTVDPVSRWLYGTFPVGSNEMLHMTRITRECCGLGRDQLVYSLEFTSLDALTQRALATLPDMELATVVVPDSTNWLTIGPLDHRTRRRTLRRAGAITPRVMEPRDVLAATAPPARLYYFALPYASAARGLSELRTLYDAKTEHRYEHAGYALPVYALTLRGRATHDSAADGSREVGTR